MERWVLRPMGTVRPALGAGTLAIDSMISNEALHVVVLGAGTMGSGIAAQLANNGFRVTLLDLTRESCQAAFERAKAVKPPHFYGPSSLQRVTLGGIDQDLDVVTTADWVCEAIIEKLDAKRDLYARLEPLLPPDALISTNTSGLQISLLTEGRSDDFKRRFTGTHFFNPPRYLKLLELIPTPDTDPAILERVTQFLEDRVGRRVVPAKDTPGFIANRFGMWAMIHCVHVAEKLRLRIEDVDAMTGPFLGRPRSASFRLNDLVGMDIMADIAANLADRCADDEFKPTLDLPRSVRHLISIGALGQKAGKGYYEKNGSSLAALDLETLLYRDVEAVDVPGLKEIEKLPLGERMRKALEHPGDLGEFMRRHLIPVLRYANAIREEVCHDVEDFDRVMMWGFGWEKGPFAMMDAIGHDILGISGGPFYREGEQRAHHGGWHSLRNEPQFRTLTDYPVLEDHATFRVRDLGEGVQGVSTKTKMGSITPDFVREFTPWIAGRLGQPLVLAGETRAFSVGYDLNFFRAAAESGDYEGVDAGLRELQELTDLLRQSRMVAAVHGYCLGAGMELAFACPLIVSHPEANLGLPEAKVGLLPGGAGASRMATIAQSMPQPAHAAAQIISNLALGLTSSCGSDALRLHYLRPTDIIALHPDRVITEARAAALTVQAGGLPEWKPLAGPVIGMVEDALQKLKADGKISEYDVTIGERLRHVFTKSTSWDNVKQVEREQFVELLKHGHTQARIRHMLETGKPLKN